MSVKTLSYIKGDLKKELKETFLIQSMVATIERFINKEPLWDFRSNFLK